MRLSETKTKDYQVLFKKFQEADGNLYEIGIAILEQFENETRENIDKFTINEFNERFAKYHWLLEDIPTDKWVKEFECNGKTYKVKQYISDWRLKEFVSMSNILKSGDILANCHLILAVMTEDENSIEQRAEEFKELPITLTYPIAVFFCALINKLSPDIQIFLERQGNQVGSRRSGVGTILSSIFTGFRNTIMYSRNQRLTS